jgi:transposase-like protein
MVTNEDGAGGKAFLHSLVAQGLAEVKMVIPTAHRSLKSALAFELLGASW